MAEEKVVTWADIPGFDNYEVSTEGHVRDKRTGVLRKEYENDDKYLMVWLENGLTKKKFRVHILVARVFIPNPEGKPEVNHKNLNRQDNRVENLEWTTHKENMEHSFKSNKSRNSNKAKKVKCVETGKVFESYREAATSIGVTKDQISRAVKNKRKAGGYTWEDVED